MNEATRREEHHIVHSSETVFLPNENVLGRKYKLRTFLIVVSFRKKINDEIRSLGEKGIPLLEFF